MEKTPIARAIKKLCDLRDAKKRLLNDYTNENMKEQCVGEISGIGDSINCLRELLPYEKQFMQGVFERGSEREVKPGQAFLPEPAPDFETLYSQFNQ